MSQFLVTSDPKPVASDQKDFLPTTSLPTKMDVVVTDNEYVETSDYKLWSACKRPNNRCKGSTTGSTLSFIQKIAVAKARATANDTCHQLHTKFIISTNPNHHHLHRLLRLLRLLLPLPSLGHSLKPSSPRLHIGASRPSRHVLHRLASHETISTSSYYRYQRSSTPTTQST